MGTKTGKLKGTVEKMAGSLEKGVGKALGNESLQGKGAMTKAKGDARISMAKGVDKAKSSAKTAAGKAQQKVGDVVSKAAKAIDGLTDKTAPKAKPAPGSNGEKK